MTTECYFGELPKKFLKEIKYRLKRLDSPRAGSIFPEKFEDGMRYVYCQILQDTKREKEIIEAYTKWASIQHEVFYLFHKLRNKQYEEYLKDRDSLRPTIKKEVE